MLFRRVTHSLSCISNSKRNRLDVLFFEYSRVVNEYIKVLWDRVHLPRLANASIYKSVDSHLTTRCRKCAATQAIKIINSSLRYNKLLTYERYCRVYGKAITKGRDILGILSNKWGVWAQARKIKRLVDPPVFLGNSLDLPESLVKIESPKKSNKFDLWVKIHGVFLGECPIILPTKHHKRSRYFESSGWLLRKSVSIRRNESGGYCVDMFWRTPRLFRDVVNKKVGVDVGIRRLMTTSDGHVFGPLFIEKLNKLVRRKKGSVNWRQSLAELRDYIGFVVNNFSWEYDLVVMEKLNIPLLGKNKSMGKKARAMIGSWNVQLLYRRMEEKAQINRVYLAFVDPSYSSQKCNLCGEIHKKSREKDVFRCVSCGHRDDADVNAAKNILLKFSDEECIVPHYAKKHRK